MNPSERAAAARKQKLADIQEQVDEGSLTIRKMTSAEKKAFKPKERPPGTKAPRRRTRKPAG